MKMSRKQRSDHQSAERILKKEKLTIDEKIDVINNWHEGYANDNAASSAFFTPYDLAIHLALNVSGGEKIIDLCAGIGTLSVAVNNIVSSDEQNNPFDEQVLLEINPEYCEIAKKLLPHAEIICGSIYDKYLMDELASRGFNQVISNPPFGTISKPENAKIREYSGGVHYEVLALSSRLANYGVFILPQSACPFQYSGKRNFSNVQNQKYEKFSKETGIKIELGVSTDTNCLSRFRGTNVVTEIVTADFTEIRKKLKETQMDLFAA